MLVVTPQSEQPKEPAAPKQPASPMTPPTPSNPPEPASPASPKSPALWPKDTVPVFMTSCTKFHVELVEPCSCIITKVVTQFTHDEFLKIDAANELSSDPKMQKIRQECVDAALVAQKRAASEAKE